jgi:hypothetical protein
MMTLTCTGSVKIWDIREKGKPVVTIEPSEGETKRDCWAVAFGNLIYFNFKLNINWKELSKWRMCISDLHRKQLQ